MRDKVRQAHPSRDASFDLKHSAGGMIDAEFAAQFLVLSQSGNHAELVDNVGNIALLERAEAAALYEAIVTGYDKQKVVIQQTLQSGSKCVLPWPR